jgi:hypothetical protein
MQDRKCQGLWRVLAKMLWESEERQHLQIGWSYKTKVAKLKCGMKYLAQLMAFLSIKNQSIGRGPVGGEEQGTRDINVHYIHV